MNYLIFIFTFLFILLICFVLLWSNFDESGLKQRVARDARNYRNNDPVIALKNASGINNIPRLNIMTSNNSIRSATNCAKGPVRVGDENALINCAQFCLNGTAKEFVVGKDEEVYHDFHKLETGTYCTIGPRPQCNTRTTNAILTINSIVCSPRYPDIFGGSLGNQVVACNNGHIFDPLNRLYDYKLDRYVDAVSTAYELKANDGNIDELLVDGHAGPGEYRFRCKFNGVDRRNNRYIEHPFDRFHPIEDYCKQLMYNASDFVKTVFIRDENNVIVDFKCDCGKYEESRVRNLLPDDQRTPCSDKYYNLKDLDEYKKQLTIPYRCFNINSVLEDVSRYLPCPEHEFTSNNNPVATVDLLFTDDKNNNIPIEHPHYEKFPKKSLNMLIEAPTKMLN